MSLLSVEDLRVEFHTDGEIVRAVDGVSYHIEKGETLGLVGESGSGKSVSSLALLGLIPQPPGKIVAGRAIFNGRDLLKMPKGDLQRIRGHKISMIFQDPLTALNPFLSVAEQMTEVTRRHLGHNNKQAHHHAISMLERVGTWCIAPDQRLSSSVFGWNAAARDDCDGRSRASQNS